MISARRPIASAIASASATAARRSYSRMTIIGRLGREPTPFTTANSSGVNLFIGSANKDRDQTTSWYRVSSFASGSRLEWVKTLPKGSLVHLECDARLRLTNTDENAPPTSQLDLVERHIALLSKPRSVHDQQQQRDQQREHHEGGEEQQQQ